MSTTSLVPTTVCFRCGVQSETAADRCPACGARYRRRTRMVLWIVVGVFVFVIALIYLASQTLTSGDSSLPVQLSSRQ